MTSISKSKRNCDRISNLPDDLITHILSFLSTEDAVRTSILSTSWNQHWKLAPLLRIGGILWRKKCSQSFINFVNRVLLNNVTPLDLFQLAFRFEVFHTEATNMSNWISMAISRHVREIEFYEFYGRSLSPCRLPYSLYSSRTLAVLKLKGNFVLEVPKNISLVSLKIFHYDVDCFEGGESFSRLVSSCPVLEELQIIGNLEKDVKVLKISSIVLKRLILKEQYPFREIDYTYELVLDTPNLQYLEHSDSHDVADSYKINTLHCLDTARFSLRLDSYRCDQLIPERPLVELFVAISNVRLLYILQDPFVNLYTTLPNFELPKFDRLIYLELGRIVSDEGMRLLVAFLQSSRQLEYLSFYLYCSYGAWVPPTDVPFCMNYNLKVIKADYFNQQEAVLSVLTYFLEKTNYLEKLILHPQKKKDDEFIKKVSMLPRASNSCRIVLT